MIAYLDSSALVKLIADEPESERLRAVLTDWPAQTSSALARVEVVRVARALGEAVLAAGLRLIEELDLIRVDDDLLDAAALLDPPPLRSLDAIHLASATSLGEALGALITYDQRMQDAARDAGLPALAPR